jgi:hypothetical protein
MIGFGNTSKRGIFIPLYDLLPGKVTPKTSFVTQKNLLM